MLKLEVILHSRITALLRPHLNVICSDALKKILEEVGEKNIKRAHRFLTTIYSQPPVCKFPLRIKPWRFFNAKNLTLLKLWHTI